MTNPPRKRPTKAGAKKVSPAVRQAPNVLASERAFDVSDSRRSVSEGYEDEAENQRYDRKSLRLVSGTTADWPALAKNCVCFANGAGGVIEIGVEDREIEPPAAQRIGPDLLEKIRARVGELTVNVVVAPELRRAANGGETVRLVVARSNGVASTSDGRYFLRVGDECHPILGDDVLRLADERSAAPWERRYAGSSFTDADPAEVRALCDDLRGSDRVKASVKEKSDAELLAHYNLLDGARLTNAGALIIGGARARGLLGVAPVVQVLRYDAQGTKIAKLVWDDLTLALPALIDAVWSQVPDFRESYELPDGMFRVSVAAYEEIVVRELLVNAFVHRPYTQRGDIFLNLHPDHLEVVNPGRLPLGVTPRNILHQSRRRNDVLARVFHDLGRMEREGSGFDQIYERLLATGRRLPTVREGIDSVHVTVPRRVVNPGIVRLIADADQRHQLTGRERITLGLLGQTEGLRAEELRERLELSREEEVQPWLGRLVELGLVEAAGRTRATRYFVRPELIRATGLDGRTTLARIEPHRLRALIEEDLRRYPDSALSDIRKRVGPELHERTLSRQLRALVAEGRLVDSGKGRWTRYRLPPSRGHDE